MLDGDKPYIKDELTLGIGECIYGLGERFGAFVKNGRASTSTIRMEERPANRRTRTFRST
jgi:hypothetical protein